jgi:hypothetical protein
VLPILAAEAFFLADDFEDGFAVFLPLVDAVLDRVVGATGAAAYDTTEAAETIEKVSSTIRSDRFVKP